MVQLKQYVANPLVLILIITVGGLLLAGKFWDQYRTTLQQQPNFRLSADKVQMTEAPGWLPRSAQQQILASVTKSSKSLLAPNLVGNVASTLQHDPWIDEVIEVRKTPSQLQIQVRYGKPLLLELPQQQVALINPRGEAISNLDFFAGSADSALRMAVKDLVQTPVVLGQPWPDPRVVLGADLARLISPWQEPSGLAGIYSRYLDDVTAVPMGVPGAKTIPPTPGRAIEFRLWTVGRNEIIWGSPVGQELSDESPADEKIAGLAQFVRLHGPIDQGSELPAARRSVLDLRSGKLVVVKNAKQASEFSGSYR